MEQVRDHRSDAWIDLDDLSSFLPPRIEVSERRTGWPEPLLGLFLHALAGLFGQVVDVVLCHQHLDAVNKLF